MGVCLVFLKKNFDKKKKKNSESEKHSQKYIYIYIYIYIYQNKFMKKIDLSHCCRANVSVIIGSKDTYVSKKVEKRVFHETVNICKIH